MKIAVLILAHKNPGQLKKLVDALKNDFDIFIHFDKRVSIPSGFQDEEHVHIIKNRFATYWGSANIILAEIELLYQAYARDCEYFILISGQDLPLLPNSAIKELIQNDPFDYIDHTKLPANFWGYDKGFERLSLFWENNTGNGPLSLFIKTCCYIVRAFQRIFNFRRKIPFDLYGGSQWFNLTRESVGFILKFINENKWFLKRFKYTRATDEIFFQTILMSFENPAKEKIKNDHLRYIDWETGPDHPRVLTTIDMEHCIRSTKIFGRKFDESIDADIIDGILGHVCE